jgi:hypothetical protein
MFISSSLTRWPRSRRSGRDYYEKDFLGLGHSLHDHYRNSDHDSHYLHGSVFRLGICEPFGKRVIKDRKVTKNSAYSLSNQAARRPNIGKGLSLLKEQASRSHFMTRSPANI